MNLYDRKIVNCLKCNHPIGEIEMGSKIIYPICKKCNDKELSKPNNSMKDKPTQYLTKRMIETIPSDYS